MFDQLKYFHSIVKYHSFSKAADACNISQSAISQQMQALEHELGFKLFERKHRSFTLTEAGEYYYQKTLILLNDHDQILREAHKLANDDEKSLNIGYLRCYSGNEFQITLEAFSKIYPDISIRIEYGNHEELYDGLRSGKLDLVLNDQRRAFSDAYENIILMQASSFIEISKNSPLSELDKIEVSDLKQIPCIIVSSNAQRKVEAEYYQTIIGIKSDIIYAENLEIARMMVISQQGYMIIEGNHDVSAHVGNVCHIPLMRNGEKIIRNYCAFYLKSNHNPYNKQFVEMLKTSFE